MPITTLGIVGTKGGTGKTTVTANIGGMLADMGFRVLMIDADPQASLSKYYPLHYVAPNGIVELLLADNSENTISSTVSNTVYPNLDIILSNNLSDDVRINVQNRIDRAVLLRSKLVHPFIQTNYDIVIIDTQGAVGPVQDAVVYASTMLLSPINPSALSTREFLKGTRCEYLLYRANAYPWNAQKHLTRCHVHIYWEEVWMAQCPSEFRVYF